MSPIPTCVPSQVLKFPIHLHPSPSFWSFLLNFCNSFKSVHSCKKKEQLDSVEETLIRTTREAPPSCP